MGENDIPLYSGKAQVAFCKGLGDGWRYLAICLEIPTDEQNGFDKGNKGWEILRWLEQRGRLDKLPDALEYIGRPDLALILRPPPIPTTQGDTWRKGSPYPGLIPFTEEYASVFFGRDRNTVELIERLKCPEQHFVAVVGASGSGKSSLVGAGLLPRLKENAIANSGNWQLLEFTSGGLHKDPFERLVYQLETLLKPHRLLAGDIDCKLRVCGGLTELAGQLLAHRGQSELLLFIDQFEELFTLCREEHRLPFINMLTDAARIPGNGSRCAGISGGRFSRALPKADAGRGLDADRL